MDGGGGAHSGGRSFQGADPPLPHLVEEDVEGGFVELDDLDPGFDELACLLVEQARHHHRQRRAVAVMVVGQCVDHRHGSGEGVLEGAVGEGAQVAGVVHEDRPAPGHLPHHPRHRGFVAAADRHRLTTGGVDSVQAFDEGGHEVTACLLAVGDDVDPGPLLDVDGHAHGVVLRFGAGGGVVDPLGP